MTPSCPVLLLLAAAVPSLLAQQTVTVPSGVPLHIRVTRTAHLHTGTAVVGLLTEPIYVGDRLVLPKDSTLTGTVTDYAPVPRQTTAEALLNADFTPLHEPVVSFTSLRFPGSTVDVPLSSTALIRDTQIVRFVPTAKKPSLLKQGETAIHDRITSTHDALFAPGKKDRALKLFYSQLPYHPQRIWAGTQFIADLNSPAPIDLPTQAPAILADDPSLDGITVNARLAERVDSKGARKGDTVHAIVTQPVFDSSHKLLLPEGTPMEGTVTQTKAARSFGRNGALRFAIRGVTPPDRPAEKVFGTLTAAEGASGQNVTVDREGNVKANPDKNRFIAPLLLAATAAMGQDRDGHEHAGEHQIGRSAVASNGVGLIARVVAIGTSNGAVATGFGAFAFAKSVYFRFLTRGHEVTFPKDTQIEVKLSVREASPASPGAR